MSDARITRRPVARIDDRGVERNEDAIVVERALEVRIDGRPVAVTLRTPGHDRELAIGFLAGEGLVSTRAEVREVSVRAADCADQPDAVELTLAPSVTFDWSRLERHFAATSACGLCGRAHLDSLRAGLTPMDVREQWDVQTIFALSARVVADQVAFRETGGLHAAAYCDASLRPIVLREDVGRHNAVDKVIGWLFDHERLPVDEGLIWVSGRAGAELVLKAARARITGLAAVGAPSSLAIELAEAAGMTLIGFLRNGRMNVYCGLERLRT